MGILPKDNFDPLPKNNLGPLPKNSLGLLPKTVGHSSAGTGAGILPRITGETPGPRQSASGAASGPAFAAFSATCEAIGSTRATLEKVRLLASYLQTLDGDRLANVATWFTGHPFSPSQGKGLQLGWALLRDALGQVGDVSERSLRQVYLKHGDLGETACEILLAREPSEAPLRLDEASAAFEQLHAARGPTGKLPRLVQLFRRCAAGEAKYLVKVLTGDLRIGLKEGLVEESIAAAFDASLDEIKRVNLLVGDIGETAVLAQEERLNTAGLVPFRPVKFMLASPEETAADIWERMHGAKAKSTSAGQPPSSATALQVRPSPVVWLEDKYDGIRCQLHKVGNRVALYSRELKEITDSFPEIADAVRLFATDIILDGEIVARRGDEVLPFADLRKRLGRRESDWFLGEEIPVCFVVFDLLWQAGQTLLDEPLRRRRAALEALGPWPAKVRLAQVTMAGSIKEIEAAFEAACARGNEGLLIKDPASAYTPGRRGLGWLTKSDE